MTNTALSSPRNLSPLAGLMSGTAGPVIVVVLAIIAIWYVASVALNTPFQYVLYEQTDTTDVPLSRLVSDTFAQERPVLPALVRQRHTPSQQGLTRHQRQRNLRQAFRCQHSVTGLRLILVDDVMTSGATLHAATHACLDAGAAEVGILALARAGKDGQAVAFCAPDEMEELKAIQKVMKSTIPTASGSPWEPVPGATPSRGGRPGGKPGGNRRRGGGGRLSPRCEGAGHLLLCHADERRSAIR